MYVVGFFFSTFSVNTYIFSNTCNCVWKYMYTPKEVFTGRCVRKNMICLLVARISFVPQHNFRNNCCFPEPFYTTGGVMFQNSFFLNPNHTLPLLLSPLPPSTSCHWILSAFTGFSLWFIKALAISWISLDSFWRKVLTSPYKDSWKLLKPAPLKSSCK